MSDAPQRLFLSPHFVRKTPDGDDRERRVCGSCGHVDYENPKIVAGSVARREGKVLLCRRAIEPRRSYWTLPAGFMELGETVADAAAREAKEEACADLAIGRLLSLYSIPRIGQVHVYFEAELTEPYIACGEESEEVGLFDRDDVPWSALAFPTVHWALTHAFMIEDGDAAPPFMAPPEGGPYAAQAASPSG